MVIIGELLIETLVLFFSDFFLVTEPDGLVGVDAGPVPFFFCDFFGAVEVEVAFFFGLFFFFGDFFVDFFFGEVDGFFFGEFEAEVDGEVDELREFFD